jgi:hypothetical protein
MGLQKFNPFKNDNQTFPSVVIPLADAPAHSLSEKADKELNQSSDDSASENGAAGSIDSTNLTLEALRAEIEADVSNSTHDSAYDRMFSSDFRIGPRVKASCN